MENKNISQNVEDVHHDARDHGGARDKAADLLDAVGGEFTLTAAESKRVLRKIDLHILPILLVVYFLQQLGMLNLHNPLSRIGS